MRDEKTLLDGPQEGVKVARSGYPLPDVIHVGKRPMGDGFAAWSEEPSERFPARYSIDCHGSGNYRFDYYVK